MILDLEKILEKYNLKINGVIHIGAHYGEENYTYDKLNIENRIFFEPLTDNYNKLVESVGSRFKTYKNALGNETKKVKMFVETANQGQSSSILKPKLHLLQYPHIVFENTEEVDMVKLDDVDLDINKYNFINIDVQGYELEVFKGSVKTLEKIDYIMAEINRDEVYENCVKINELNDFLSSFGFVLVEQDWAGNTWGDGFYIKKNKK